MPKTLFLCSLLLFAVLVAGCATAPKSDAERQAHNAEVKSAVAMSKEKDPGLAKWFDEAYGYAVFPTVGKGGMGVGGAYGRGEVFEQGELVGYTSLAQASIGFQFGGQAYTELVFFKDKKALDHFTSGNFEFSAQASAIVVTAGAATDADYSDGVAVFTMPEGGLMYEASIGGQKFSFDPE